MTDNSLPLEGWQAQPDGMAHNRLRYQIYDNHKLNRHAPLNLSKR